MKRLKGATLEGYISGLRSYHVDRMWPVDMFTSETLRRIIKGSYELYGRQKQLRLPITKVILDKIIEDPLVTKEDANLRACYLLTFAAFLRLGEVTYSVEDKPGSDWFFETKVTRSCVRISPTADHLVLHLKRSKTDVKNEGVSILVAAIDSPNCPVKAITHLLAVDPQGIDPNGITLHSFRKGAAQHAKDSGLRDDQIQTLGRWSSQAFKLYFKTSAATLYAYNIQFQTGKPLPFGTLTQPPP